MEKAKESWLLCLVENINGKETSDDHRPLTPKDIWMTIREIERGPRSIKSLQPLSLRRDQSAGGAKDLCSTPEENAKVMLESLEKTFSSHGTFDPAAVDSVPLRPERPWMNQPFSDKEFRSAVGKLRRGASAGDAQCPVEYYQALEEDPETRVYLREVIGAFWASGSFPGDEIPNGPPDLAEPTIRLARSKSWRVSFRQDNPKKAGSASWIRYESYKASVTLQEAIDKGEMYGKQNGSGDDLNYDCKHCFLKRHDPSLESNRHAPGQLANDSEGLM